jgi:YidC/Oxa1 family membrane protein insertase
MSWFWTIVAGTAFWRVVVLPLSIKSSRNSARLAIHGAAIQAASKRLTDAAKEEDPKKRAAAAKGVREAYAMAGVTPSSAILVPFLQIPVAFGVFFGIKGMCQFPVEQLKHGGLEFLPDLTAITSVVDPYYLLPIITVAMLNVHFKVRGAVHVSILS